MTAVDILSLAVLLYEAVFLYLIAAKTLRPRRTLPGIIKIIVIFLLRAVRYMLYHKGGLVNLMINITVDYLSAMLLYRDKAYKRAFVVLTTYAFMFISDILPVLALSLFEPINNRYDAPVLALILSRALLAVLVLLYKRNISRIQRILHYPWLAIPPVLILCLLQTAVFPAGSDENLYYAYPSVFYGLYIVSLLAAFVFFYAFRQYWHTSNHLRHEVEEAEKIMALQQQYYNWLFEKCRDYDGKLHDIKQHLAYASSMSIYLSELGAQFTDELIYTGNPVADSIIFYEKHVIEQHGLILDTSGVLSPEINWLSQIDLFIVIDNAVRNAVAATLKLPPDDQKLITIRFADKGTRITIQIINATDAVYNKSSEPIKQISGAGRGIGMQNIQKIAAKYDGYMEYETKDKMFYLSVLLQSPQSDIEPNT